MQLKLVVHRDYVKYKGDKLEVLLKAEFKQPYQTFKVGNYNYFTDSINELWYRRLY